MELIDHATQFSKKGDAKLIFHFFLRKPFDNLAGNLGPYELFGVVKARLDQIGQVVVFGGADQPWARYR